MLNIDAMASKTIATALHTGAQPKERTIALPSQPQPGAEPKPQWHPYHVPLGTLITNELPLLP